MTKPSDFGSNASKDGARRRVGKMLLQTLEPFGESKMQRSGGGAE